MIAIRIPSCSPPPAARFSCRLPGATILLAALLGATAPAGAVERLRLQVGAIDGDGWSARDVAAELDVASGRLRATVAAARLPAELGTARGLVVECPRLELAEKRQACAGLRLAGSLGALGRQRVVADVAWQEPGMLAAELREVGLAGGRGQVVATLQDDAWRIDARLEGADLVEAAALLVRWVDLPAGLEFAGRTDVAASLHGRGTALAVGELALVFEALTLATADGTIATDGLAARVQASVRPDAAGTQVSLGFASRAGQAYVDPVFLDFGQLPLEASAELRLGEDDTLVVERFDARQPAALALRGSGELDLGEGPLLRRLLLEFDAIDFPGAGAYVGPFLATTNFKNVVASGRLQGDVELRDGVPVRVEFATAGTDVDDPDGALQFTQIAGRIRWYDDGVRGEFAEAPGAPDDVLESRLGWASGRVYGLQLGETAFRLETYGRGFRLLEPAFVPIFDGGIAIETLRMRHVGLPEMWLRLDAQVQPISVALLSRAFGWPEFGGTLSGGIPMASLDDGVLTFGGNLEARVFGGRVVVSELRLEQPLGRFPRLFANARAENLDLQAVTGTFEFGEITGRLSGEVQGLELFDWMPVRFDARFATPPDARGPRRISQRAVKNLSSIGEGGNVVAAVLQGGVLRFFESFRYRELGISCVLARDVCRMDGVGTAPGGGFYIVRGAGLPRLDIIGNGRRIAWTRLVRQLAAATAAGGPEVR